MTVFNNLINIKIIHLFFSTFVFIKYLIMKANYIRVSTTEQNTARQEQTEGINFIDHCSGSIPFKERPEANKLMKEIDRGNITEIEVHSIDRLGRNTLDIMQTIQDLTNKRVNVISKKEGLQTIVNGKENPVSKLMVGILGTLAEFELNRIRERQAEGIAKAQERGAYTEVGRPEGKESIEKFLSKKTNSRVYKLLKAELSLREVKNKVGCSLGTVQKVKKLMNDGII